MTNPAGTAQMTIGLNGVGAYTGKLFANNVVVASNSGSVGTLTLTAGSLGTLVLGGASGSQGSYTINPGSVTNGTLTLGAVPGSSGTLNWGGRLMLGGVTDPNTLVNNLLGTSFGKDRSQTLAITTNYVNAALPSGLILGENAGGTGTFTWTAGTLAITNGSASASLIIGAGGAGAFNLNRGSAAVDLLTLGNGPGSVGTLTWGGFLTVGGVSDPNVLANNLLGSSFGKDRSQTLAITTNYVNATLPNGLILGENAGGIGNLAWAGGTLTITNSGGSSQLIVGAGGSGSCSINGGTAVVDRVVATNYLPTATNSPFSLGGGTLITRGNCEVLVPSNGIFNIRGTWNVTGGTVIAHSSSTYGDFQIAANSALVVSGPGTVFTSALWMTNNNNVLFQGVGAQLIVSNGAQMVFAPHPSQLQPFTKGTPNNVRILITDPGSLLNATNFNASAGWRMGDGNIGYSQFTVSNQAQASLWQLSIGCNGAYNNTGLVTAAGQLTVFSDISVGNVGYGASGGGNMFMVSASGQVSSVNGYIGNDYQDAGTISANGNLSLVTDPGSTWCLSKSLYVGYAAVTQYVSDNVLRIANYGTVAVTNVYIGSGPGSNCLISLDSGGKLLVTNATAKAFLKVLRGAVSNDGGVVVTDQLLVNTNSGSCIFRSGSISTRSTTYSNGTAFVVGGSASRAVFQMLGGNHGFSNGMTVAANGVLAGTGTVFGAVTVASGGALSPGNTNAAGVLTINGSLSLLSGAVLEADIAASATDRVVVVGTATLPVLATIKTVLPADYDTAHPAILLSAAALAGVTDLSGWTVTGYPSYAPVILNGTTVVLKNKPVRGTAVFFR